MFERYLSEALTTYFGSIVENLNAEQVRLSAWKGECVLHDLHLKPNALDVLSNHVPVEIAYGKIGKLQLKLPWSSVLKWQSSSNSKVECSIILTDLCIIITPKMTKRRKQTTELSRQEQRVEKEESVQRLLDAQLFERLAKSNDVGESSKSWAKRIVKDLLSNLSVTIQNIHVRYEDAGVGFTTRQGASKRESFAAGVTLRQFSIQTTDNAAKSREEEAPVRSQDGGEQTESLDGEQTRLKEPEEKVLPYTIRHKRAAAYQLAVYWDRGRGCHLMTLNVQNSARDGDILQLDSMDSLQSETKEMQQVYFEQAFQVMNGQDYSEDFVHWHLYDLQHTYLLSPVSPSMEFALVSEPSANEAVVQSINDETSINDAEPVPPSSLDMSFPPCSLTISANVLEDTAYLRKSLAIWGQTRKSSISEESVRRLTSLRPTTSPLEDPLKWWKYAVEATLVLERRDSRDSKHRRHRGWLGLCQAVKLRREYVALYEKALCEKDEWNREEAHRDLIQLEDDLAAEEIAAFRLSVYSLVSKSFHSLEATSQETSDTLTWSEWVRGKKVNDSVYLEAIDSETFNEDDLLPLDDVGIEKLTLEHRLKMYIEMTEMLQREEANQKALLSKQAAKDSARLPSPNQCVDANEVAWKTCMAFRELSVQIDERIALQGNSYGLQPVVRLSCALIQRQTTFRDDSWQVDSAIASLQVVDLTGIGSPSQGSSFLVLLGSKQALDSTGTDQSNDTVEIDDVALPLSASVSVKRIMEQNAWNVDSSVNGEGNTATTTSTIVRLMPLEIVYSTNPVAALKRALSTIRTPELTDDYYRMASVISQWRNRQKGRLLRALADKQKQMIVSVDIAAPVVLIPEDPKRGDSPLLVIDLGRLKFSNTNERIEDDTDFDDNWELSLDNVHVQCSSTAWYRRAQGVELPETISDEDSVSTRAQELIEPFSLHFTISTRIEHQGMGTVVNVYATLPRLVFNLTSSAVRLVTRLKLQWLKHSQVQSVKSPILPTKRTAEKQLRQSIPGPSTSPPSSRHYDAVAISRRIQFYFSAPVIVLRLENDVDGRGSVELSNDTLALSSPPSRSCPLVDVALRGIRGEFIQTVSGNSYSKSCFDARLRSVIALDLYQKAGDDFALLLSSLSPSTLSGGDFKFNLELDADDEAEASNDLVSVRQVGTRTTKEFDTPFSKSQEVHLTDSLAITFHELFVEWNPETIAAIHKGMQLPKSEDVIDHDGGIRSEDVPLEVFEVGQEIESDDEFFDAIEATAVDGHDSSLSLPLTKTGEEEDETPMISEISSRVSSLSDVAERVHEKTSTSLDEMPYPSTPFLTPGKTLPVIGSGVNPLLSSPTTYHDHFAQRQTGRNTPSVNTKSFEVTFKLSTLRVNFNKDSRRRRVLIAEMDGTEVFYTSEEEGISNTKASIGNLSFTDPTTATNATLYKEILGLKSDAVAAFPAKQTSLLEVALSINPRIRHIVASGEAKMDEGTAAGVSIDCRSGTVGGSDISMLLRLSPMRFVYLQQLWLEIVDYFFEAIIGYEVWGKQRPCIHSMSPSDSISSNNKQYENDRLWSSALESHLPGFLAEEFSFTQLDIRMDEPTILIPVSYLSPQFLRLEFSSLMASNYYHGAIVGPEADNSGAIVPSERVQWFNNCAMELNDLKLKSWEGAEISGSHVRSASESTSTSAANARIRVNWPVGRWALSIVPKWKVECNIDRLILNLRRDDYALLQHIILYNIGELSRHLEEWDALQNLPPSELDRYKKEIMVHFGYDKKDTEPTTYDISLMVPSIKFFMIDSAASRENTIMEADCTMVEWQMRKLRDRISRQRVTCDIALAKPRGRDRNTAVNSIDLLLPMNDAPSDQTRELSYTSTTQPSGDNVKMLSIVNACIFAVYPAWVTVKDFFSNLPEADFMGRDEVGLAMQIGDRWYRIASSSSVLPAAASKEHSFSSRTYDDTNGGSPSFQFRLLLRSPRIILSSEPKSGAKNTCVVLRMDHFDFLHQNDGDTRKTTKTFFVHDLELYTSSSSVFGHGYVDENSLLHPWCISGQYRSSDPRLSGTFDERDMRVKADMIQATAAYSDMSVAVDVGLQFLSDLQESQRSVSSGAVSPNTTEESSNLKEEALPRRNLMAFEMDGFELLVVDDSLRHFAHSQELVKFSLRDLSWYQEAIRQDDDDGSQRKRSKIGLNRFTIYDCLQSLRSPFRLVATSHLCSESDPAASEVETTPSRMTWSDFRTVEDRCWGFKVSQILSESVDTNGLSSFCDSDYFDSSVSEQDEGSIGLVELNHIFVNGVSDEYAVNLRPLTVQWNPSTVIALQRFLGRLRKEAMTKFERDWIVPSASSNSRLAQVMDPDAVPTRVRVQVHHLVVSLNKEHQHRCLLRVTLSDMRALFEHDSRSGMTVEGSISDIGAWDTDSYATRGPGAILDGNRKILQVVTTDAPFMKEKQGGVRVMPKFLQFRFKTFAGSDELSSADALPSWVSSRLVDLGNSRSAIDDYLSVSIAMLRLCYIRERTEEILDYLSNGLPGKGMGATSKAAKGFINKRIQTKSYLDLNIQAPHVYVPQHEKTYRGVLVVLGDVEARSWFEEANLASAQNVWYRMLSLSLTGLYWSANEKNSHTELSGRVVADTVPLDVKIDLKKPTKRGNAIIVRGSLSCIELNLTYTVYILLKAIMKDNLSRKIDVSRWDNVEKAYSMEEEGNHPLYSSDARFIRYGQDRVKNESSEATEHESAKIVGREEAKLDCLFSLEGLRLKLHRNDPLEGLNTLSLGETGFESSFCYDIVVLRADRIEVLVTVSSTGDKSLQLSLSRLGVYDLGDGGRLARDRYKRALMELDHSENNVEVKAVRNPCAFSVLIEGYSSSEDNVADSPKRQGDSTSEPQLLITVDTCSPSSAGLANEDPLASAEDATDKIILARMVFNYLSINALIRPMREIVAFLTCSWSLNRADQGSSNAGALSGGETLLEKSVDQFEEHARPGSFRHGLQLKVVAHYPRVFFVADESDPLSRSLVLRGLAVLDTSIVDQETIFDYVRSESQSWSDESTSRFTDKKIVTAVNAQLHSMETYINPNVEKALGMEYHNADIFDRTILASDSTRNAEEKSGDEQLGVALIQPVTAGVEFCQIKRDRFPTLESFSVNMEPVSTILSFEDLSLIESILERWSSRGTAANSMHISMEGSSSHTDDARPMSMISQTSFRSDEKTEKESQTVSYNVTFESERLGLVLKRDSGDIIVERMQNRNQFELLQAGDALTAINGVTVESLTLDEVVELLSSSPRPVTISFSRHVPYHSSIRLASSSFGMSKSFSHTPEESDTVDSVDAVADESFEDDKLLPITYVATFRCGVLNGLTVEPSPCGALPVVIDVLPSFFLNAISIGNASGLQATLHARLPRTGAIVAEINGKPSSEIGYLETKELLDTLSSQMTDAERLSFEFGKDSTFTVKFIELDSAEWGKIKTADIGIAGIALTFVDDFKGRDMPLLRGKLDDIDIRLEQGLGIEPRAIHAAPPDILELATKRADSRDIITMIRAVLQTEIDYYHPRIAIWEPLLEPSNICFMVEWQPGSSKHPGQLAVETSDRLVGGGKKTEQSQTMTAVPRFVSLNLTDAAAEVLVRTNKEWKDWRQRSLVRQIAESQGAGNEESQEMEQFVTHGSSDTMPWCAIAQSQSESTVVSFTKIPDSCDGAKAKHIAAQKAAKAALVFAQKRGAGTRQKTELAKPFVFRNRTGMSLSFMQQERNYGPSNELQDRPVNPSRDITPTFLADGDDARFHMEVTSQDQQQRDEVQNLKRVRAYDGQYPSLCVKLEAVPGIVIQPLSNLPVFVVGNTISRLEVRKVVDETILDGNDIDRVYGEEFSVPVVWTVEIEDNRRVLTLSSAVRVISSGINLSVDVGVEIVANASCAGRVIRHVGTAHSGTPFYLPLGLALACETVEVFVKPSEAEYDWSKESVLTFVPIQASGYGSVSDHSLIDWSWKETFDSSCTIPCEPSHSDASNSQTLWLSLMSLPHVENTSGTKGAGLSRRNSSSCGALISIAVDSGLTLRNLLPVDLQWEIGAFVGSGEIVTLDSSAAREHHNKKRHSFNGFGLRSGEGVDILSFHPGLVDIGGRFRCHTGQRWSEWALLPEKCRNEYSPGDLTEGHLQRASEEVLAESEGQSIHLTRQVNVQIQDEFGVPITIGVRVVPKIAEPDSQQFSRCIGYDAFVFAELWLRNLTPLPLVFGCPSIQINKPSRKSNGLSSELSSDEAGIVNAEAALIELASILEFGDRGKGVNLRDDNASITTPDTCLLPYQTADTIFEEVFEYVEVENFKVKRKWWGSERHDSRRQDPNLCSETGNGWQWIDDGWKIDCSGQSMRSSGGWESCRSLIGGKADYFSLRRQFSPSHPFRRRRWFRRRRASYRSSQDIEKPDAGEFYGGINAFHQPVEDAFTRTQEKAREILKKKERSDGDGEKEIPVHIDDYVTKISIKCGDGQWSDACIVPQTGGVHGIIRMPASRWPTLTKLSRQQADELPDKLKVDGSGELSSVGGEFAPANLSPALYELCYKVAGDLGEGWSDLSRIFFVTPRFMLRNDSKVLVIEAKQSGSPDEKAITMSPGEVAPFFWADFRLPELVCVRPVVNNAEGRRQFRWSGGFDVCTLGMSAIRVRRSWLSKAPNRADRSSIKSIRTLVEIRSGTGGTGINVSFKEEDPLGTGSLFRIENLSPFLIWVAQDGVLANPSAILEERRSRMRQEGQSSAANPERRVLDDHARTDGDLIEPGDCTVFALDVPFRQGKYAGRKAASMSELTRIRIGLAPLSSRDGVESTKVVSLSAVGDSVRLSPAKLSSISAFDIRKHLVDLRVLGVVTTDGPTRVLRFCMMRKNDSSGVFDYTLSNLASSDPFRNQGGTGIKITSRGKEEHLQQVTLDSAVKAIEMDASTENEALRSAFFGTKEDTNYQNSVHNGRTDSYQNDTVYSFRASFCGFSCSLIDKVPSEIALITLKDIDMVANWNKKRSTDSSVLISIGWLQVDNFVPSAPFPVAVCPVKQDTAKLNTVNENQDGDVDVGEQPSPLLLVGLTFAPKHKSGILCLKSATIAPRDLAVSVDLAFVVRLQQFFGGIIRHYRSTHAKDKMVDRTKASIMLLQSETRQLLPFPDIESMVLQLEGANAVGVGSQKLYFEGLSILPCNINLSVAPARALTSSQASLEGSEAAALHTAVRKGDLLVGGGKLAVTIGHKNQTAVSVVRGVFKSIIVDALLRCESASLNFSGVYLRNHISSAPQLRTFLGAHYLESLKSNVPALLGSMAALGNPLGLIRGIGDGMSDFVNEPVKGLQRSLEELDPSYIVGGVARGTKSLARHAVGGFAGSASLLTETFSKNMAVITLDRRYAQRRDRRNTLRSPDRDFAVTFFEGVESGAVKLLRGVWDGVSGVVRAPIRGAERHGMEGFAKGIGKGLLGLLVKPVIGISDAATDVMIGVQGSVEGKKGSLRGGRQAQIRPRRPMYGPDRILRPYSVADTAAATLMLRTRLAGENYLSHYDMDDKVALLSVKRALLLGADGQELLVVKYKNIEKVTVEPMAQQGNGDEEWAVVIVLKVPQKRERPVHVIKCKSKAVAIELCSQLNRGVSLMNES